MIDKMYAVLAKRKGNPTWTKWTYSETIQMALMQIGKIKEYGHSAKIINRFTGETVVKYD
jgi:hypothetical protein